MYVDKDKFRKAIEIYQNPKAPSLQKAKAFDYIYVSLEKLINGYINKYKLNLFTNDVNDMKITALTECFKMLSSFDLNFISKSEKELDKKVNPFNYFQTIARNQILNIVKKQQKFISVHILADFSQKKDNNTTTQDEKFFMYNEKYQSFIDLKSEKDYKIFFEELLKILKNQENNFLDKKEYELLYKYFLEFLEAYQSFDLKTFINFCRLKPEFANYSKKKIRDFYYNVFLERTNVVEIKDSLF